MWQVAGRNGTPDGGSSWFVAFAAFMTQFVVIGVYNVYGLLYIELLKESNASEAIVAWIGSISFSLQFIIGPFTTALCTRFGCRVVSVVGSIIFGLGLFSSSYVTNIYQMYATYSFVFAIGSSFCYFTSILILNEYFSRRLVLANGIALAGCGFGTLAIAPVMNFLLETFHWRQALRLSSAAALVLALCGLVYFLVPAPIELQMARSSRTGKLIDLSVFKNKAYVVWVAGVGLIEFGFYIPYVHLVRHCQDLGIPKSRGAVLVGVIAISQTVGKLIYGRISDHPKVNRVYLFQMSLLVCGVMTTLLPVFISFISLMVYCVIFGLHDGCFVVLIAVLTGDIAGKRNVTSALGLLYLIAGFPLMLGPAVAGWIYDSTKNYEPAFYMAGAFTTLAVCLLFLVPWLLPAEVEKEWQERSLGYQNHTQFTNSTSTTEASTVSPSASELSKQRKPYENSLAVEDELLLQERIKTASRRLTESMEHIPADFYCSTPKPVPGAKCVLGSMMTSSEYASESLQTNKQTTV